MSESRRANGKVGSMPNLRGEHITTIRLTDGSSTVYIDPYPTESGYHDKTLTFYERVSKTFGQSMPSIAAEGKILDMGCSRMQTTIELATLYPACKVFGIDMQKANIKLSRSSIRDAYDGNVSAGSELSRLTLPIHKGEKLALPKGLAIADGFYAPFRDGTFDAVFCMNNIYVVMEKVEENRRIEIFQELRKITKPNGYLLISGRNYSNNHTDFIILQNQPEAMVVVQEAFSSHPLSRQKLESIKHSITQSSNTLTSSSTASSKLLLRS